MSELEGLGKGDELQQIFLRGTRAAALLSLWIGALFLLDGQVMLRLWVGERFVASYPLLMTLTAGYVVTLAQYPSNVLICALNRHQALGWWTLAEGVINLFLSVHWARSYGLVGVAMGTTLPMVFTALILQPWYVLRLLKLPAWQYVREGLLRPLVRRGIFLLTCRFALTPPATASLAHFLVDSGSSGRLVCRPCLHSGFVAGRTPVRGEAPQPHSAPGPSPGGENRPAE